MFPLQIVARLLNDLTYKILVDKNVFHLLHVFAQMTFSLRSTLTTLFKIIAHPKVDTDLLSALFIFQSSYHFLAYYIIYLAILFIIYFSSLNNKLNRDKLSALFTVSAVSIVLEQCPAHSSCLVTICHCQ